MKKFFEKNIFLILILVYFVRFSIPQGSYSSTATAIFYQYTVYFIVGFLVILGIFEVIKLINSRKQNRPIDPQSTSLLFLAILGLVLFGFSCISRYVYLHEEFSSGLWRDKTASLSLDSNFITPRQRMMNDLANNILPGLTRTETLELLGKPDDSGAESDWVLLYRVAPEQPIGMDMMCLVIVFDGRDDYFKRYETYNHCG
jgi:hypothetical protein